MPYDPFVLILISFAAWRFARVLYRDSLFEGTQRRLDEIAFFEDGTDRPVTAKDGTVLWIPTLIRSKVLTLATCMWCGAFWCGAAMLWVWYGHPWWDWSARDWIVALAVAAPGALFTAYEDHGH